MIFFRRKLELSKRFIRPLTQVRADWSWLSANSHWMSAVDAARGNNGKKILISTMTGSNWACSSFDSLLGIALTLRGHEVQYLLCDGILDACQECDFQRISPRELTEVGPQNKLCVDCFSPANKMLSGQKLRVNQLSKYLNGFNKIEAAKKYSAISHSSAGVLRFFGKADATDETLFRPIYDRFETAYLKSRYAVEKLIDEEKFDCLIAHHGIYVPQGACVDAFEKRHLSVVTWNPGYKTGTFLFSHQKSYHYTMPKEDKQSFENKISIRKKTQIINYLELKKSGVGDWIKFYPRFQASRERGKTPENFEYVFGLFSNVNWDAQVHFENSVFENQTEWIVDTINFFIKKPSYKLIIRIHPAEHLGSVPSREPLIKIISDNFTILPDNIEIIEPESKISSYVIAKEIDIALVYGSKIGIELACKGIQVVVSGECWGRNKGFTIDVVSKSHYLKILKKPRAFYLPKKVMTDNALSYAYYLFFERSIFVALAKPLKAFGVFKIVCNSLEEIRNCNGLNSIVDAIETGRPFKN